MVAGEPSRRNRNKEDYCFQNIKCPWKFSLFALCDEFRIRDDFQGVFRKGPIIKSSNKDTGSFTSKKIRNDRICSKNVMTPFCTLVLLV